MSQYWTACHTQPGFEPKVRAGIEELGIGTFLPSYAKFFYKGTQIRERRRPLLPGYIFVCLPEGNDQSGEVEYNVPGVRVLRVCGKPARIPASEVADLMIAHASGVHNVVPPPRGLATGRYTKRRRRPRHGRAIREKMRQQALAA